MRTLPGYTLLELVMVTAILAMIIIALPAMGLRMNQQGVGLAVDQLKADIQLARLMAIKNKEQCAIVFHEPDDGYFPGPEVWDTRRTPPTSGITQPPVFAIARSAATRACSRRRSKRRLCQWRRPRRIETAVT